MVLTNLLHKKCVPCEGGIPPLTSSQISEFKKQLILPWLVIDTKKLKHEFRFKNFKKSMEFVNKVAALAEEEGHHPDISIFYNIVEIQLWTHTIGGLSDNDFILAAKIEQLTENNK